MNIFVIDKDTRQNLGTIDFIPRKEERIILNNAWKNLECKVRCVVYHPKEHSVLVFVDVVENYYEKMTANIEW